MDVVLLAFILVLAIDDGRELFVRYVLESLGATDVTSVSVDQQKRLDFRNPSDYASNRYELPKMNAFYIANSHRNV